MPHEPVAALYARWQPAVLPYPPEWHWPVSPRLLQDWQQLVVAATGQPSLPDELTAELAFHGIALDEGLTAASWLALHDLLIVRGWRGDSAAFARSWKKVVHDRVPGLGRLAVRALPAAATLTKALTAAGRLLPGPAPVLLTQPHGFGLQFADLPLYRAPTFAVWAAAQAESAWALLQPTGRVTASRDGPLVLGLLTR